MNKKDIIKMVESALNIATEIRKERFDLGIVDDNPEEAKLFYQIKDIQILLGQSAKQLKEE